MKVDPVGEFELKGISRPLAAYNVLAENTRARDQRAGSFFYIRHTRPHLAPA